MKKIYSWNVNGIRAVIKKNFEEFLAEHNPDILCLQETKAQDDQVREALFGISDYHLYSNSAERKGYSGVAILSKEKPIQVTHDIGITEHDTEGRVITAEYDGYYLVNVYVPNSGNGLKRLDYRAQWDIDFKNYLSDLEKKKPVILCGDLNVCHQEIDIARPKSNYNKSAGYTQKEIDGLDAILNEGMIDSFRYLHPDTVKYSWWSYRGGAREKNVGWRLDYFVVSKSLISNIKNSEISNDVLGSDHCPVFITIE